MIHHARARSRALALLVLLGLLVTTAAWAEKVEFVTYYPSPAATSSGPPPPPDPFTLFLGNSQSYDMYMGLWLWQQGVTNRSDVTVFRWRPVGYSTWGTPGQFLQNSPPQVAGSQIVIFGWHPPTVANGIVVGGREGDDNPQGNIHRIGGSGPFEVEVDWKKP